MITYKITEKNGFSCLYNSERDWTSLGHGKPERWVLHKDEPMAEAYDEADVLEERIVDGIDGTSRKEVKLKAEYLVEIEDISAKVEQERINAEALAYLASTDWMVIREIDAGVPCPVEVKAERAAARARIVR